MWAAAGGGWPSVPEKDVRPSWLLRNKVRLAVGDTATQPCLSTSLGPTPLETNYSWLWLLGQDAASGGLILTNAPQKSSPLLPPQQFYGRSKPNLKQLSIAQGIQKYSGLVIGGLGPLCCNHRALKYYSIFVVHSGTDRSAQPLDGHQYWKAQIISIHSIRSKQWFLVRWFYTSSQLKEEGLT